MSDSATPPSWVRRMTTLFVIGVILAIFFTFFSEITTVLLGVLAATIVACSLNPLLRYIPGPRGVGAGVIGLTLIAVAAALVLGFSLPLAQPVLRQFENWPQTQQSVDQLLLTWSTRINLGKPITSGELVQKIGGFFLTGGGSFLISHVQDAVLAIFLWIAFVFVGSIFLMASPRDVLLSPALRAIPPRHRNNVHTMLDVLGSRLRWWMIGTIGGMAVVFSASCIGYSIAGLKFAIPLALLAGLCEIVPTVGPATAALVALLFAASQNSTAVVGVIITYAAIQSLEAYLILPMIMRGAVKIHPAITLFSVFFWAKVLGVPGLMMAIPINLVLGTATEYLYVLPRERRDAQTANESAELAESP
jgi:predicted PurR-regulated permease PerM